MNDKIIPAVAESEQAPALQGLLAQAIAQLANPVFITDEAGKILWTNKALCELSGYAEKELLGQTPAIFSSGRHEPAFYERLWQTVLSGKVWHGKVTDKRKDGSVYLADEVITPLRDEHGVVRNLVAVQQDITETERQREHDHYLAHHDPLTGLVNRSTLFTLANNVLSNATRTQHLVAMMFIDLDGFKAINDRLGHYVGDQLLAAVAQRLRTAVRQSDTIARIGGDEFAALIGNINARVAIEVLASKLIGALAHPFALRGQQFSVHASIGIALFPDDGQDPDALLDSADRAMYEAKLQGGNRYQFYARSTPQRMSSGSGAALAGPQA